MTQSAPPSPERFRPLPGTGFGGKLFKFLSELSNKTPFATIGLLTVLVYAGFCVFYTSPALSEGRLWRELFLWPGLFGLLLLYGLGYAKLKQSAPWPAGRVLKHVAGFALVFGLFAAFTPPYHSTDLFGYVNRGWQQFHYGLNPYVFVIDDIPNWTKDPMIRDHWVNNPCPYGFLFAQIAKWICQLGNGNLPLTLALFKGLNLAAIALCCWLVWSGARKLKLARPDIALYLFLWNPLLITQQVSNGHNDILMGTLVLLGGYLAAAGAWIWVLPSLIAATLVKYAAAVTLPFALVLIARQKGWNAAAISAGLGLLTFLAIGAPYIGDWQQFRLAEIGGNATLTHNSLHSVFYSLYKEIVKLAPQSVEENRQVVGTFMKNALWLSYIGFLSVLGWRTLRGRVRNASDFIGTILLAQFALICVVSSKFYAWYVCMFFPLAFLLEEGHPMRRLMVVVSVFQLFSLTFLGQAHMINYLVMMAAPIAWVWMEHRRVKAPDNVPMSALEPTPTVGGGVPMAGIRE